VLYFEGDTHSSFRLVRAIKNRFGAVNEIGVFAMTEKGPEGRRPTRARSSCRHTANPVAGLLRAGHAGRAQRPDAGGDQALVDSGGPEPAALSVGLTATGWR
jgi:DNA repair protein RadA/Sms